MKLRSLTTISIFSLTFLAGGIALIGCDAMTPGPHRLKAKTPKVVCVLQDIPANRALTAEVLDEREVERAPEDCVKTADELVGKKVTYGLLKDQPVTVYDVTNAQQTEAPETNSKAILPENEVGVPGYPSTIVNCMKQVGAAYRRHDFKGALSLYQALMLDSKFRDNVWVLRGHAVAFSKEKQNEAAIKEMSVAIDAALTKLNQPDGFTTQAVQRLYHERSAMYRQIGNNQYAEDDMLKAKALESSAK